MWFRLQPTELDFAEAAPFKFESEAVIDASADTVFAILADCAVCPEWFRDFREARWLTEPPHGVGSRRIAVLKTLSARERFVAWEPGRRFTFVIEEVTLPLIRRGMEDYQLEPVDGERSRLRLTMYYQPRLVARLVHPLVRAVFRRMFRRAVDGLAAYAAGRRGAAA